MNQMRGSWKVKNEALRGLWREAMRLATTFDKITYNAVRREHNELATGSSTRLSTPKAFSERGYTLASRGCSSAG